MDSIIKKWNEWIIEREEYVYADKLIPETQYLEENNIKLIDLKHLANISENRLNENLANIMKELNIRPCVNRVNCSKYKRCMLCKIDYLLSIDKVKIIV